MLEKDIERKVCAHAKKIGMEVYKFSSPARAAVPDRMFLYKKYVFFIEFKATGKKPTAQQVREHNRMSEQGVDVFIVDNVNNGKFIIDTAAEYADLRA